MKEIKELDIHYYDMKLNEFCKSFEGHKFQVTDIDFSKDMRYIISGSVDKTIKSWKISDITGIKENKLKR